MVAVVGNTVKTQTLMNKRKAVHIQVEHFWKKSRKQIQSPWLGGKVDSGIGLPNAHGKCVGVDSGVDMFLLKALSSLIDPAEIMFTR